MCVGIMSVVTWNIRHGGGTRADRIIDQLRKFSADVLVVTEFRNNAAGERIKEALGSAGYVTSNPLTPPRLNSVLVASRFPIRAEHPLDATMQDQRHLWVVELGWISLCAVYMPLGDAKPVYWLALARAASGDSGPDLYIGDFNTGNNKSDLADGATAFLASEHFDRFGSGSLKDVWRAHNPGRREYSWFSARANNGFRLDHAFANEHFFRRVSTCEYIHEPRTSGLSDHSAMRVSFSS